MKREELRCDARPDADGALVGSTIARCPSWFEVEMPNTARGYGTDSTTATCLMTTSRHVSELNHFAAPATSSMLVTGWPSFWPELPRASLSSMGSAKHPSSTMSA